MTKEQTTRIKHELELIRRADPNSLLQAEAIIEFARNASTELHRHFEWDDGAAAAAYRLAQARQIIRVQVTMLDAGDGKETSVRAFVSLVPRNGYHETVDVMTNKRGRRDLLLEVLSRMLALAQSYPLSELKPIVSAIGVLRNSLLSSTKRGRPRTSPARLQEKRVSP